MPLKTSLVLVFLKYQEQFRHRFRLPYIFEAQTYFVLSSGIIRTVSIVVIHTKMKTMPDI